MNHKKEKICEKMDFEEMVVIDNMGNRVPRPYFMEKQSVSLYENMFGKDTNAATKPLPEERYCEYCGKEDEHIQMCTGCRRVRYCSAECQNAHWSEHKPNCKVCCEVIFTYAHEGDQGQDVYNVYMSSKLDEESFVKTILDTIPLKSDNLHDLHHLMKLSTAIFVGRITEPRLEIMPFRKKNNGKYFFNNKLSPGPGTKKWEKFLKDYINKLEHLHSLSFV